MLATKNDFFEKKQSFVEILQIFFTTMTMTMTRVKGVTTFYASSQNRCQATVVLLCMR